MQYVTFVTPGPLSPGCGVELGCPAWRWPESVLSAQSAAAPAPEQQTDCYIYTTSTYSYNSLLKCKMLEFMGRNTEIDEEFWWSNKARLGLRVLQWRSQQSPVPSAAAGCSAAGVCFSVRRRSPGRCCCASAWTPGGAPAEEQTSEAETKKRHEKGLCDFTAAVLIISA